MRRGLTPLCRTSSDHTTAQVKGAVENREVRRREVTCGTVSGKSLARVRTVIHGMDSYAITVITYIAADEKLAEWTA
jgi:hypothetical protein